MRLYKKTADTDDPRRIWQVKADLGLPVQELMSYAAGVMGDALRLPSNPSTEATT
jgi:hypothetical protein